MTERIAAALESGASAFSFTFGLLPASAVQTVKAKGMYLMGTATTVEEALQLEKSGVDIVPRVQINTGGTEGGAGGSMQALIGMLLSEKGMGLLTGPAANDAGNRNAEPTEIPAE